MAGIECPQISPFSALWLRTATYLLLKGLAVEVVEVRHFVAPEKGPVSAGLPYAS